MSTKEEQEEIVGFDYSQLPTDTARFTEQAAADINHTMTSSVVEVGNILRKVKNRLPHGQFLAWLRAEFEMSERSAQRYIAAASLANDNRAVAELPATALYALSAPTTPQKIRKKIIESLQRGQKLTSKEIIARIQDHTKIIEQPRKRIGAKSEPNENKLSVRFSKKTDAILSASRRPAYRRRFRARVRWQKGQWIIVFLKWDRRQAEVA